MFVEPVEYSRLRRTAPAVLLHGILAKNTRIFAVVV